MHTTHYAYPFQGEFITGKNTRFLNAFALRLPVVNRPRLRREIAAYQVNRSVVCSILTGISFFLDLFQRFLNAFALRLPVVNRPRLRREIAAYQVNRSVVCSILTGISFFLDLFQGFSR